MLGEALEAISRGQPYFSEAFQIKSAKRSGKSDRVRQVLTDRERLILIMLSRSPTDRIVGDQLGISPETVEKHRFNIFPQTRPSLHCRTGAIRRGAWF